MTDKNEDEPMGIFDVPNFEEGGIVREAFIEGLQSEYPQFNLELPTVYTTILSHPHHRTSPSAVTRCMLEIRSKKNRKLDTDYPHFCFRCKKPLFFHELLNVNQHIDRNHLEKLWKSKYVQFYCCVCYKIKNNMNKHKERFGF